MPSWTETVLEVLSLVGMLVGVIGLIIPFFPGLVVVWLAQLAYGLLTGFNLGGGILFGISTVLMLVGGLVDNFLMGASAREQGTSWLALGVGMAATLVASLYLTPIGGLVAGMVAVFLVEWARLKDWRRGLSSLRGLAYGWGGAIAIRILIGLVMIALWFAWRTWF
jgi:uncharacterized protein YqgC (DUF456 family)